jgi:FtsP/CotA-like multicopper oxidase with cupredoxin domain
MPMMWDDPITENPNEGDIEVWEIHNHTMDAHPIHIHEVMFEVVNRESMDEVVRGPEPWETGVKDTVIAFPDEITRIKALFDLPGQYVWHCHIVEHEDNEMMRPYSVGPVQDPTL